MPADPIAVVLAELDRLDALPTVINDSGRADSFGTGAQWTIRMIREAIERGAPADPSPPAARLTAVPTTPTSA